MLVRERKRFFFLFLDFSDSLVIVSSDNYSPYTMKSGGSIPWCLLQFSFSLHVLSKPLWYNSSFFTMKNRRLSNN